MKVGNKRYECGTRVRLVNITDPNDMDLNGKEGSLCRPIRDQRPIQEVGVKLDLNPGEKEEYVNVFHNEFEVI